MGTLGSFALILAAALAAYGCGASIVGGVGRRRVLLASARTTAYSLLAVVAAANAVMLVALLADDFGIRYVAENSSRATPTFFKVLALWAADAGSLLLWNLVLAGYIAAVAFRFRRAAPETFAWAMAVMYGVSLFYLVLVLGPTQPFAAAATVVADGRGPLPLLQNHPLMAAHPPFLYLGFIGFTVPFAFAIAALISGRASESWMRLTRRWTLAAWAFLTVGLLLGALWSYGVLGWGGYWAWDPVENVALLPWLMATAFLHSVVIQERRAMLKVWNLSLIVGTFALTTFGTFLTRGSILTSVHAFAESLVGPLYLGFLVVVLAGGFGLIALRSWRLRTEARLESPLSREAVFLGNNLVLVALTLVVLIGTIFPLAVEALSGRQVTVGGPYFEQTTVPLFLLLLFLMAVGPLVPWRRADADQLRRRMSVPLAVAGAAMAALAVAGMRNLGALAAIGLAAFVVASSVQEIARAVGSSARRGGWMAAAGRNRRLVGGLVAHVGLGLAAVAITASNSFSQQVEVSLGRGEEVAFAGSRMRYVGERVLEQPHRTVVIADVAVTRDGREAGMMSPSLNMYPASEEPIGTPSIRYGVLGDLYATVLGFEDEGARASFRFLRNPGVMWLWVGGAVIAIGAVLAAWPSRRRPVVAPEPVPVRELVEVG